MQIPYLFDYIILTSFEGIIMKSALIEEQVKEVPKKMSIYNAFRSGKITKKSYDDFLNTGYSKNQLIDI